MAQGVQSLPRSLRSWVQTLVLTERKRIIKCIKNHKKEKKDGGGRE
jgi:hypothetical protein